MIPSKKLCCEECGEQIRLVRPEDDLPDGTYVHDSGDGQHDIDLDGSHEAVIATTLERPRMPTKTIWKFPIPCEDIFKLDLPLGAKVLTVQTQIGTPCIWVLVDPEMEETPYWFRLAGTGHPLDPVESETYVGTFQLRDGALVFHLFQLPGSWRPT